METMFIWLGSGFAFAVGWMAGMVVMGLMLKRATPESKLNAESVQLLRERNDIGHDHAGILYRIADAVESMAANK